MINSRRLAAVLVANSLLRVASSAGGAAVVVESGFTPAGLAYLADIAGQSNRRGAAMGIYTLLLGLGSALGAGVGGVLGQLLALNGLVLGTVALTLLPAQGEHAPAGLVRDAPGAEL